MTESGEALSLQALHLQRRIERSLFGITAPVTVGRYALDEWLGSGGTGTVYAAHDHSLDRRVAIKVLTPRASTHGSATERLIREAKALARLAHPHVLTVHEVGIEAGQPFIVMELMPGGTLAEWMLRHHEDPREHARATTERFRECAEGLLAAHEAGFVHRDFKPQNVLLDARGRAKVADFGLVMRAERAGNTVTADGDVPERDERRSLTAEGTNPGTPGYMAPEQHRGQADARTDQFALCTTFREVYRDTVPLEIEAVLVRGTSPDPELRFPDLRALLEALDVATRPRRRSAVWVVGGVAIALAGVAVGVRYFAGGTDPAAIAGCSDERAALDAAWGSTRRAAIRTAFEHSASPSWRQTWDGASAQIDDYARAWVAARVDACEATKIRRVADERTMERRLACLDQRRAALEQLSDAYLAADASVVDDALVTAHALPSIASCSDRAELAPGREGLGLDDPRLRAAYGAVGRAEMLRELGRDAEARAAHEAVATELEALGASSLLSVCLRGQARLALDRSDYESAEVLARAALHHAELAEHADATTRAWLTLAAIARSRDDYEREDLALGRAENLAAKLPEAAGLQSAVVNARGAQHYNRGHASEALPAFHRALALADEAGESPPRRFAIQQNIIGALSLLGRDDEARALGESLLEEAQRVLGPRHLTTLGIAAAHGQTLMHSGDWLAALRLTAPAVDIPIDEGRADALVDLWTMHAAAQAETGDLQGARRTLERALAQAEPVLGPRHQSVVIGRIHLGTVLGQVGDWEAARLFLEDLVSIIGTEIEGDATGAAHPINRALFWTNMATAQLHTGQRDEAVRSADLAIAICRAFAPQSFWMFSTLVAVAEIYEQAGTPTQLRAVVIEALEIAGVVGVGPAELASIQVLAARLK